MNPAMTLEQKLAVLRLAGALSEDSTEDIARATRLIERSVAPGTVLTREGGSGSARCLVILSGAARVTRSGREIATVGAGTLLDDDATVTAITLMQLLVETDPIPILQDSLTNELGQ